MFDCQAELSDAKRQESTPLRDARQSIDIQRRATRRLLRHAMLRCCGRNVARRAVDVVKARAATVICQRDDITRRLLHMLARCARAWADVVLTGVWLY